MKRMALVLWCGLTACFDYGAGGPGESASGGGTSAATDAGGGLGGGGGGGSPTTGGGSGVGGGGSSSAGGSGGGGSAMDGGMGTTQGVIDYLKASNAGQSDVFSYSLAISGDGRTLAVGAINEDSSATGVNGAQGNDGAQDSGAVYVFVRVGGLWQQQAYLKASNSLQNLQFGESVSLSGDGDTLAVGAQNERSTNGNQADTSAFAAGATYVFTRQGGTWSQQAYLKASSIRTLAWFGLSTALSSDGNTLVVGARGFGSSYVFVRVGTNWTQQTELKASNHDAAATDFGRTVAISGDGNTIAVGWPSESSIATGVNGSQGKSTTAVGSGAVYVFARAGSVWTQQAYVKASNTAADDKFGSSLCLNHSGTTLAVGARWEDSAAVGVNGNQSDNTASNSGAVYVFTRSGSSWAQQAYLKASDTNQGEEFGGRVALSGSGDVLAVGAENESSEATGLDGNQANSTTTFGASGAVYLFQRQGNAWAQTHFVKASNTRAGAAFGGTISLTADGFTLAVGSLRESSGSSGINGNQTQGLVVDSGATYVYALASGGMGVDGGSAPFDPPPQCVLKGCLPAQLVNDPECSLGAQNTMQISLATINQTPKTMTVSGGASTDFDGVSAGRPSEFQFQLLPPFPAGASAVGLSPSIRGTASKAVLQLPAAGLYQLSMNCYDSRGQAGVPLSSLVVNVSP